MKQTRQERFLLSVPRQPCWATTNEREISNMWMSHVQLTPSWAQRTSTPNRMYFSLYTGRIISSKAKAYGYLASVNRSNRHTGFLYFQVKLSMQASEVQQFAGRGADGPAGATNTHSGALVLFFFLLMASADQFSRVGFPWCNTDAGLCGK